MAEITEQSPSRLAVRRSPLNELLRKDDWWAVVIGLRPDRHRGDAVRAGGSIKWIAVAPQKWSHLLGRWARSCSTHGTQFLALFVLWAGSLGLAATALGPSPGAIPRRIR